MASSQEGEHNALVLEAMEDYVVTRGQLPSTSNLRDEVGLSRHFVEGALERLRANGEVKAVYEQAATVWLPAPMWQAMLHYKKSPEWLDEHALDRRKEIERDIRDQREELDQLRRIEDLLHASGLTLEEAIYQALEILKVEDLVASFEDGDRWDFSFRLGDQTFITEAKGKTGAANKRDVNQLGSWVEKYLEENDNANPEELCGLVIINHYKDAKPDDRWPSNPERPPLTVHAESFLRLRDRHWFLTTVALFELATQVLDGRQSPEEAREGLGNRMRRSVTNV